MKRPFVFSLLTFMLASNMLAQEYGFGSTSGYFSSDVHFKTEGNSIPIDAEHGFLVGFVGDFKIADGFGIRPELVFTRANASNALFLPFLGKVFLTQGLHIQAGPMFGFHLDRATDSDLLAIDLGLTGGLGLDFPSGLFFEARYGMQFNNSYTGNSDITIKSMYLTVGIGFIFNEYR